MESRQLIAEMDKITETCPNRTSFFQLNFFLLGTQPTIQAKMHKCADELKIRRESIENAYMQLEEFQDQLELLNIDKKEIKQGTPRSEIERRILGRREKQILQQMEKVKSSVRGLEEESLFFVEAYNNLRQKEEPKSWDSDEVQLEYWSEKFSREIRERMMFRMPLELEVIRSIQALPDGAKVKNQISAFVKKQELLTT